MKIFQFITFVCIFFISCNGFNQEKNSEQINEPHDAQSEKDSNSKKVSKTESSNEKLEKKNLKKPPGKDDWYWENTMMSTQNQFKEWNGGAAEISLGYRIQPGDQTPRLLKIGTINSEGKINIDLPIEVATESQLNKINNILFFDIQNASSLNYTNGDAGYFANSSLFVTRSGKKIGNLTMGNSVRVTYNLNNPSMLTAGDEGYILYWAFVENDCSLHANETWTGEVRRDGTNTFQVETTVDYDLNFKSGWNLIKTEVVGKYDLEHERGLDASWYKAHKHTVIDEISEGAEFFFRTPQYQ